MSANLQANTLKSYLTLSAVVKLDKEGSRSPAAFARHFWERVDQSGECWEWNASRFDTGYGCVWVAGKARKAHRVAWSLTHGPIPDGVRILHSCDNPPCCRPEHLFAGSSRDNTADMVRKGRHGGTVRRKLTAHLIPIIRERYAAGATLKQLGADYGVTFVAIWKIVNRKTWADVA